MQSTNILEEALRLRKQYLEMTGNLNSNSLANVIYLITNEALDELFRDIRANYYTDAQQGRLFDIPVRISDNNAPDTPKIQLLIDPLVDPVQAK